MCTLSNINKCLIFMQRVHCVLLFLVLAGNSARFRICLSYTRHSEYFQKPLKVYKKIM